MTTLDFRPRRLDELMETDPLERCVQLLERPEPLSDDHRQELKHLLSQTVRLKACGVYVEDCYKTLLRLIDDLDDDLSSVKRQTILSGVDALRDEMRLEDVERAGEGTSTGLAATAQTDTISISVTAIAKR